MTTIAEKLNSAKIRPTVIAGGKVGLYSGPSQNAYNEASSAKIEAELDVSVWISKNPLSDEPNNLVVWADASGETAYFNKTTQSWVMVTE